MTTKLLVNVSNVRSPGAVSLAISLLRAFERSGKDFEYIVLTSPDSGVSERLEPETHFEYVANGPLQKIHSFNRFWTELRSVPSAISRIKPDAFLALGNLAPAKTAVPATVLLQHPLIADTSLPSAPPQVGRLSLAANRFLFRRTAKHASAIIVQTPHMQKAVSNSYGVPPDRIHVVPNNVSESLLSHHSSSPSVRAESPQPGSALRLIYPAAPYKYKNFDLLFQIGHMLKNQPQSMAKFVLTLDESAGPGKAVMNRVRSEGLDSVVENIGVLDQPKLAAAYAASSALFFPSLAESFGNPLLEAASFGLPVLAADLEYAHDVVGDAAIYFGPRNVESALAAIDRLRNESEWQTHSRLARSCFESVPSWNEIGERFLDIIESTIQR